MLNWSATRLNTGATVFHFIYEYVCENVEIQINADDIVIYTHGRDAFECQFESHIKTFSKNLIYKHQDILELNNNENIQNIFVC